ncbi:SDR family oxidoreductase [Verrucomicrobia bacterium]|nr:SDR family oxidoreductase [Verrucomicrobiota bacterium]
MGKTAVVTGAGSGVGQASAITLAKQGWNVAIIGRREEALLETVAKAGDDLKDNFLVCPCDIGKRADVAKMGETVRNQWPQVEAIVNSAGTNTKERALQVLSDEDYEMILSINLSGSYYTAQEFLPGMRERKKGTVVNIVSEAGVLANPKAGTAYIVSKFGQNGLTQAINTEERVNGIRACSIFPGDINTPLLDRRPSPPPMNLRGAMLQPQDLADCVALVVNLPANAVVEEIMIRPQ